MIVEFGRHFVRDKLDCRTGLLQQGKQWLLHRHNDLRAARLREIGVAAELDDVAEPLLPPKKQGLAGDVLLAEPERLRKGAGRYSAFLAPFVLTPAPFELL